MYAKLFESLLKGDVKFLVLGGAAVSLHGFPRMTTDIDILLKNSRENLKSFNLVAGSWGSGSGSTLTYEEFQGPGCVRIEEDFTLDVFIMLNGHPYEYFIRDAAKHLLVEGVEVQCLSISHLIELKKGTSREKDQLDVTVLQRLQGNPQRGEYGVISLEPPPSH